MDTYKAAARWRARFGMAAPLAAVLLACGCANPRLKLIEPRCVYEPEQAGLGQIAVAATIQTQHMADRQIILHVGVQDASGRPIRSSDTPFSDDERNVAATRALMVLKSPWTFDDARVAIPVEQLHLKPEDVPATVLVSVRQNDGTVLASAPLALELPAAVRTALGLDVRPPRRVAAESTPTTAPAERPQRAATPPGDTRTRPTDTASRKPEPASEPTKPAAPARTAAPVQPAASTQPASARSGTPATPARPAERPRPAAQPAPSPSASPAAPPPSETRRGVRPTTQPISAKIEPVPLGRQPPPPPWRAATSQRTSGPAPQPTALPTAAASQPHSRRPGDPPGARRYLVRPGDTLSSIARQTLGDSARWREIYDLNRDLLETPDAIYEGMILKIPD